MATALAVTLTRLFPLGMMELPVLGGLAVDNSNWHGRWETVSMTIIWSVLVIDSQFVVSNLYSFQMAV